MKFLIGEKHTWAWLSGSLRKDLEDIKRDAVRRLWWRALLGNKDRAMTATDATGVDFVPDSDDETPDGSCNPYLNFKNPLWKVALAYPPRAVRPLDVLFDMLGTPHGTWA